MHLVGVISVIDVTVVIATFALIVVVRITSPLSSVSPSPEPGIAVESGAAKIVVLLLLKLLKPEIVLVELA